MAAAKAAKAAKAAVAHSSSTIAAAVFRGRLSIPFFFLVGSLQLVHPVLDLVQPGLDVAQFGVSLPGHGVNVGLHALHAANEVLQISVILPFGDLQLFPGPGVLLAQPVHLLLALERLQLPLQSRLLTLEASGHSAATAAPPPNLAGKADIVAAAAPGVPHVGRLV